jgi:hypothetical protein
MDEEKQYHEIQRFLKGKYRKEIDAFCIYQWIDRCYFSGWWDLGCKLASSIPPNSLNQEYHKRLEYLLSECRNKLKDKFIELKSPKGTRVFSVPKSFWDVCDQLTITLGGSSNNRLRLEYLQGKVILLETIKTDRCTLCFTDKGKDKLAEWLDNHGFGYLKADIKPKRKTHSHRSRLRVSWEEASKLIPILCEEAKGSTPLIKALKSFPPEVRREIEEILKRELKTEAHSAKITNPPSKLDGTNSHLDRPIAHEHQNNIVFHEPVITLQSPTTTQNGFIRVNTHSLKVEKENFKAMIDGFWKNGRQYYVTIFTSHKDAKSIQNNFFHLPKVLTTKRGNPRPEYPLSEIGKSLKSKEYNPPARYVAVLDRMLHIENDINIWDELCQDGIFDIWQPVAPFNSLQGKQDPTILILRIFEANKDFSEEIEEGTYFDKVKTQEVQIVRPIIPYGKNDIGEESFNGSYYFADIVDKVRKATSSYLRKEEIILDTSKIHV